MGAGDYDLSTARTNQALFGFGDAVAVPAVSWLAENYLMPLVRGHMARGDALVAGDRATERALAATLAEWRKQKDHG